MKVYRLKKDIRVGGPGLIISYKKGWLFCEQEVGLLEKYVNYANPSYPISKELFENNVDSFDFVIDDNEHDSDYYLQPIYSEYQLQEKLTSLNQKKA